MTPHAFLDRYVSSVMADRYPEANGRDERLRLVDWLKARCGSRNPTVFRNLLQSVHKGQMAVSGMTMAKLVAVEILTLWQMCEGGWTWSNLARHSTNGRLPVAPSLDPVRVTTTRTA